MSDKWESLEEWLKAVYYAEKYGIEDSRLKKVDPPDFYFVERIEPEEDEISPFVQLANEVESLPYMVLDNLGMIIDFEELRTDAPVLWTWKRLLEKTVEIWHRKE